MERHCILCGARIEDHEAYQRNKEFLVRPLRYQEIIDVLVDSPRAYDLIFFDHQEQLPSPYRGRAIRQMSALQEAPGEGRQLHKKEADVTAVRGGFCDIVIEEEMRPTQKKIDQDIDRIVPCRYLWANGRQYVLQAPCLFVVVNDNVNNLSRTVQDNVGFFRRVIVCEQEGFAELYEMYCLGE